MRELTKAVIRKVGSQYCIFSKTGKRLGCFPTREAALKRLRQIEFFKHQGSELRREIIACIRENGWTCAVEKYYPKEE
jgi:hypothetical protein